ncbi:MAG: hypothetical protein RLZZ623_207 [Actinomycetota bacterium]
MGVAGDDSVAGNDFGDPVAIIDSDLTIVGVNTAWADVARREGASDELVSAVGRSYREACGTWLVSSEPDLAEQISAGVLAVASGDLPGFEADYVGANGTERRWFHVSVSPLSGSSDRFVVVHRDDTERMNALREIADRTQLADRVGAIAKIGGWDFDLIAMQRTWLPGVFRLFELDTTVVPPLEEFFGFFEPTSREALRAAIEAGAQLAEPWDLEVQASTASGRPLWLKARGSAVVEDGRTVRLVGTLQDITERKVAEMNLESMGAQLHRALRMESVGRLAGGVAHDFNNMLGVILGRAEVVLGGMKPGDRFQGDLIEIRDAAGRSAALTRQLLAFARQQMIEPKVLDLNTKVPALFTVLQRLVGENIALAWRPGDDLWPVKIDPSQIDQILTNLCVNARDAIGGAGTIVVETANCTVDEAFCAVHPDASPGDYVRLTVSDDGHGMDSDLLANIFDPFFTNKEGSGLGLGLATVYGAVRQNDGFLSVASSPAQGATFDIYLRRYADPSEVRIPQGAKYARVSRSDATILLIEDEPALLKLLATVLGDAGYHVLAAEGAEEAAEMVSLHRDSIRLLITDVILPGINGRDLADQLASIGLRADRLYMSGYANDVISRRGVLDPKLHFIHKPFSIDDLLVKVESLLGEQ